MDPKLYFTTITLEILCFLLNFVSSEPLAGDEVAMARKAKFSSVVVLQILVNVKKDIWYDFCTGTLISKKRILTSVKCLRHDKNIRRIDVLVGAPDCVNCKQYQVRQPWQAYEDWIKEHRKELRYPKNDIILLELTEEVVEKDVEPAQIASSEEMRKLDCSKAYMVGWIRDAVTFRMNRYFGKVVIKRRKKCERAAASLPGSSAGYLDTYLCTNRDHRIHSTEFDTGGPLFNKNGKIVGVFKEILSSNFDPKNPNFNPSGIHIFTSIDYYRDYIQ